MLVIMEQSSDFTPSGFLELYTGPRPILKQSTLTMTKFPHTMNRKVFSHRADAIEYLETEMIVPEEIVINPDRSVTILWRD